MYIRTLIFWLVLNVTWREISSSDLIKSDQPDSAKTSERTERSTYSKSELGLSHPKTDGNTTIPFNRLPIDGNFFLAFYETCSLEDFACLAMAANDRLGYQAIQSLHQKLDDDANGNIDYTESDDVRPRPTSVPTALQPLFCYSSFGRSCSTTPATRSGRGCSTAAATCTYQWRSCGKRGCGPKCTTGRSSRPSNGSPCQSSCPSIFLISSSTKSPAPIYQGNHVRCGWVLHFALESQRNAVAMFYMLLTCVQTVCVHVRDSVIWELTNYAVL